MKEDVVEGKIDELKWKKNEIDSIKSLLWDQEFRMKSMEEQHKNELSQRDQFIKEMQ